VQVSVDEVEASPRCQAHETRNELVIDAVLDGAPGEGADGDSRATVVDGEGFIAEVATTKR